MILNGVDLASPFKGLNCPARGVGNFLQRSFTPFAIGVKVIVGEWIKFEILLTLDVNSAFSLFILIIRLGRRSPPAFSGRCCDDVGGLFE